jgi:putative component of toxin-antitoxin plasmid stabilization module
MSIKFQLLTPMYGQRVESSSPRSNGDSNRFGPAGVSLPHDICRSRSRPGSKPKLTYINPYPDLQTWTSLRYPGAQYPLHCVICPWRIRRGVLHGTPTISIRPVRSCLFKLRINRGKGLPEYVASTGKVLTTHRPTTNGPQSTQAEQARPGEPICSTYHDNQFRPFSY